MAPVNDPDMPKLAAYNRARAHPIHHIGEAAHPERGTITCVTAHDADAMRDELLARIADVEMSA